MSRHIGVCQYLIFSEDLKWSFIAFLLVCTIEPLHKLFVLRLRLEGIECVSLFAQKAVDRIEFSLRSNLVEAHSFGK